MTNAYVNIGHLLAGVLWLIALGLLITETVMPGRTVLGTWSIVVAQAAATWTVISVCRHLALRVVAAATRERRDHTGDGMRSV